MARKIRSPSLENRTNRLDKLAVRKKAYTVRIGGGVRLAYRRCQGPGTWSVAAHGWLKRFALADDFETANGTTVLDYDQAVARARKMARGEEDSAMEGAEAAGRPATVAEAVESYRRELVAIGKRTGNATRVAFHLPPVLAAKPVGLLTLRDFKAFRDHLVAALLKPATVARTLKMFMTAMRNAAADDPRINIAAWQLEKMPALVDSTVARGPLWVLGDDKVNRAVKAAYAISYRFGLYVEVVATFGCRPISARRITVGDLEADRHVLQMPSSLKGKGRLRIDREPLQVPHALTLRLTAEAAGRGATEPLLRDDAGNAWEEHGHPDRWERVAVAAKLPLKPAKPADGGKPNRKNRQNRHRHVGMYCLRHSSIARNLLRGLPVALVARTHDTSEAEIRSTYGRYITHADAAAEMLRKALPTFEAPAPAVNVVPIPARATR